MSSKSPLAPHNQPGLSEGPPPSTRTRRQRRRPDRYDDTNYDSSAARRPNNKACKASVKDITPLLANICRDFAKFSTDVKHYKDGVDRLCHAVDKKSQLSRFGGVTDENGHVFNSLIDMLGEKIYNQTPHRADMIRESFPDGMEIPVVEVDDIVLDPVPEELEPVPEELEPEIDVSFFE